jgi:biopolymer transport protein ExbD
MKFPRTARILRSQFDAAPSAAVFFCLMILLMLGGLVPVQGLRTQLTPPTAENLPGMANATVAVAMDAGGRVYFANQLVASETQLSDHLRHAATSSRKPPTLVIHADKAVTYDQLVHLILLSRNAGISNALLATLPGAEVRPSGHE